MKERFGGIDRLYGNGALARFAACHVTVVGIGGVGSWAVEALARSGIGRLTLIDADDLCVSNTNRQLPALEGQYGRAKIEAMAERCRAINPRIELDLKPQFLTPSNLGELLEAPGDLVLDACDSFRTKVESIAHCRRRKQPIVTVGSAGGRSDVTQIRVRDLSRTEHDAMLSLIRKKLRGATDVVHKRRTTKLQRVQAEGRRNSALVLRNPPCTWCPGRPGSGSLSMLEHEISKNRAIESV